jgi:predicted permease
MLFHDAKHAFRTLRNSPAMALTAISALALGIGANTAVFSVVNAVLLRPFTYPQPERIVQITRSFGPFYGPAVTATKFDFWRGGNHSFEAIAAFNFAPVGVNLAGTSQPERLNSLPVTAAFFRVLGVQPWRGRAFNEAEDRPSAGHFAVISYSLWQRLFHGDTRVLGSKLTLNNAPYTILGVMPAGFEFAQAADVWTPLQLKFDPADHANDYEVIARLKPGVSLKQANEDMHWIGQLFRKEFGGGMAMGEGEDIAVLDYHSWIVGDLRPALRVLMAAVGFVLLIACVNVANLLLTRSALRQHEMALRAALGASGRRLIGLLLTESLLLALAGSGVGIVFAEFSIPVLLRLAPASLPRMQDVTIGWPAILFAVAAGVVTALVFGLLPAVQTARAGITNSLREAGTRTTTNASAQRTRHVLVVIEVAISLMLLVGAGLLIETFKNLRNVDLGFDARNALTTQMSLGDERFRTTAATSQLVDRVVKRLEAMPGVVAVGTISSLPTQIGMDNPFEIIGRPTTKNSFDEFMRIISPNYFSAMQIPVVAGRTFTQRDTPQAHPVIIVNQAFARKYFPHENPLGQQILVGRVMGPIFADAPREIIGVVGDTHDAGLGVPPQPIFFEPVAQMPDKLMALDNELAPINWIIRTDRNPMGMSDQIRRETLAASGDVPMAEPHLLSDIVGSSIAQQRFSMTLLSVFASVALVLGAVGIYGVISYSVAQRRRELGIRAALGAARSDLLRLVLAEGMWLAGIGLVVGLLAAFGLTQFLKGMLFGVTTFDGRVLASVCLLLAGVAFMACWGPARRAAQVDPAIALRDE